MPKTIPFAVFKGGAPTIILLDINKFGNTINIGNEKVLEFKRPQDNQNKIFVTYIDQGMNKDDRLWM